jgi:hypothetical protein
MAAIAAEAAPMIAEAVLPEAAEGLSSIPGGKSSSSGSSFIGDVVVEGAKTVFKVLGNLMNEGYENRTADNKLRRDKELRTAQNELAKDLHTSYTADDIKKSWELYEQKKKEIDQTFNNNMLLLDKQYAQENKKIQQQREDKELTRQDIKAYGEYLKRQIDEAPDQESKNLRIGELTKLYGRIGGGKSPISHSHIRSNPLPRTLIQNVDDNEEILKEQVKYMLHHIGSLPHNKRGRGVYNPDWTITEMLQKNQQTKDFPIHRANPGDVLISPESKIIYHEPTDKERTSSDLYKKFMKKKEKHSKYI